MLSRFQLLWGSKVCVNPLTKENLQQNFFSDNVEWSPKNLLKKMISTDIKTDVKQEIKVLVAVSFNFSKKYPVKT